MIILEFVVIIDELRTMFVHSSPCLIYLFVDYYMYFLFICVLTGIQ